MIWWQGDIGSYLNGDGNFFMFLKTNKGYLSQIALKKHVINCWLHFSWTYFYSFLPLGLSINFPKLVIHNIDIVIVD